MILTGLAWDFFSRRNPFFHGFSTMGKPVLTNPCQFNDITAMVTPIGILLNDSAGMILNKTHTTHTNTPQQHDTSKHFGEDEVETMDFPYIYMIMSSFSLGIPKVYVKTNR